jgi:hypothetical protein
VSLSATGQRSSRSASTGDDLVISVTDADDVTAAVAIMAGGESVNSETAATRNDVAASDDVVALAGRGAHKGAGEGHQVRQEAQADGPTDRRGPTGSGEGPGGDREEPQRQPQRDIATLTGEIASRAVPTIAGPRR